MSFILNQIPLQQGLKRFAGKQLNFEDPRF